ASGGLCLREFRLDWRRHESRRCAVCRTPARPVTRRKLVRVRWGGILIVLLGVLAAIALITAATPMGRYLARGAMAEAKILARRQSIAKLAADSTTPPAVRAKLNL